MNVNSKLFLKLAKTIYKYLMTEGDCRDFVSRLRMNRIIDLLIKINDSSRRMIPYSLNKTLKENKLEMVELLSKLVFTTSDGIMRNPALGLESHDVFGDMAKLNEVIGAYLFSLAKSAPDFIVRVSAVKGMSNQVDLIYLASDKNRSSEIRMEAINRITDQEFLEAVAADLRESYEIRNQALLHINSEVVLKRIISNDKYDVVMLGMAIAQYKKIKKAP